MHDGNCDEPNTTNCQNTFIAAKTRCFKCYKDMHFYIIRHLFYCLAMIGYMSHSYCHLHCMLAVCFFCFRQTVFQMSVPKRRRSNVNCRFRVDVRSDLCNPQMEVLFSQFIHCLSAYLPHKYS